jgi:hypothetical protein
MKTLLLTLLFVCSGVLCLGATCTLLNDKTTFAVSTSGFSKILLTDHNNGVFALFAKFYPEDPKQWPAHIQFDLVKQVPETKGMDPNTLPVGLYNYYATSVGAYFYTNQARVTSNTPTGQGTIWGADCKL